MKKNLFLTTIVLCAAATLAQAAPQIEPKEISTEALLDVATERQKKSIQSYEKARKRAEDKRQKDIEEIKEITRRNNDGLKDTIKRDHLDSMLPPCEREPRMPREPGDYYIFD